MSRPPFLELPPGAESFRLGTPRGEFAVSAAGRPRLGTALLVPGFTGSKEDFLGLLAPLADAGLRVVALDQRGQNETPGPAEEAAYAQRELARDVHAVAEAVGSPLHLLGHSLGGLVCRAAVLADAAPFRSLTLVSSGPGAVCAAQQERIGLLLEALPALGMAEVWAAMGRLDPTEAPSAETPPRTAEFLRRRWLATVPQQLVATARQLRDEPDRTAELAAVGLPLHVLSGEDDEVWPVPWMDAMAERLGARRTVVAGTAHSPNAERPRETARALAAFWSDVAVSPRR